MERLISTLALEFIRTAGEYVHGLDYERLSPITVVNRFIASFGVTPRHCSLIWHFCRDDVYMADTNATKLHLLWTLNLLKTGDTEHELHGRWRADEKTIRKWVYIFLRVISEMGVVSRKQDDKHST